MEYYDLKEPSDNIGEILLHIAKSKSMVKNFSGFDGKNKRVYDLDRVSNMIIKNFFDGHLGKAMLDDKYILEDPNDENDEDELNLDKFV